MTLEFLPSPELSEVAQRDWDRVVRRPDPVYVQRVDEPFEVLTDVGRMTAEAGDYIAHDPASGHFWPVKASYLQLHYEPTELWSGAHAS